jgi:NAD(P)-dependent dehydrogenase (short-subunit alcohol dehydrogenase family)
VLTAKPMEISMRSPLSRRAFLMASAVGTSAAIAGSSIGFVAGWPHAAADDGTAGIPDWTAANIPPQLNRRVIITGGNGYPQDDRSGLGFHQALELARAGADVTIASRNLERGQEAVRIIQTAAPGATIRFARLDLADLSSVRDFASQMRASGRDLDLLINNAGSMGRFDREVSVDGFERVFATNTLGHFALTALLLPLLHQAIEPRIVWVSSSRTASSLQLNNLQLEQNYDYAAAYDQSKLANLMLALEFDRRSTALGWGISSIASHPGVARTNLIPNGPGWDSSEGWRLRMLPFIFQPPADGALPILYAAAAPAAGSGRYYGPNSFGGARGLPGMADVPAAAQDSDTASRLWSRLEQMSQVSFGSS